MAIYHYKIRHILLYIFTLGGCLRTAIVARARLFEEKLAVI